MSAHKRLNDLKMKIVTKVSVEIEPTAVSSENHLVRSHVDVILACFETSNAMLHLLVSESSLTGDTFDSSKIKRSQVSLNFYVFFTCAAGTARIQFIFYFLPFSDTLSGS